jgi:hypothetical protein
MNATRPRLVEDYLNELDRALAGFPSARRREIVADIEEHIDHQLSELGPAPSDSQGRSLLDRVGDPDELAAEARDSFDVPAPQPRWTTTSLWCCSRSAAYSSRCSGGWPAWCSCGPRGFGAIATSFSAP